MRKSNSRSCEILSHNYTNIVTTTRNKVAITRNEVKTVRCHYKKYSHDYIYVLMASGHW